MSNKPFLLISIFLIFAFYSNAQGQNEHYTLIGKRPGACYGMKKAWTPEWFQGSNKRKEYFEGWYFKIISADGASRYAFIPGVSLGKDEHSFIQVIDGSTGKTEYFRFPLSSFSYSNKRFAIKIDSNYFSADSFYVDLGAGNKRIAARIQHSNLNKFPVRFLSPGIMGWYRFVPFMECFHGVVSIDHLVNGQLVIGNDSVAISNGKGYIEKDWGRSMPSAWVWTQSNNFSSNPDASFMMSVANIPWMGSSFTGFLGYLYANGQLYKFATYTGAKITVFEVKDDEVRVLVKSKKVTIEYLGKRGKHGELLAPVKGDMERTIHESIDATISIKLIDNLGHVLFEGFAPIAGLEIVGDVNGLKPVKK